MQILPEKLALPMVTVASRGCVVELPVLAQQFGTKGAILHGKSLERNGCLDRILRNAPTGMSLASFEHHGGEPTLSDLAALLNETRKLDINWMAAVGGGSVLDLAKACAGLFNGKHDVSSYHDGLPIEAQGIPFLAAPTTAGTGSEATMVSVLIDAEKGIKKSIRDPSYMARLALLDSELLASCPPGVIACSGMDAFTQAIESYSSIMAVWWSRSLALKALELIADSLESVYQDPASEAADSLLTGSYLAGMALSASRLGVVHGLAHPLGARYHLPHGLVCAVCLPYAIELNRDSLGSKYDEMSEAAGGDLLSETWRLLDRLGITSPFAGKQMIEKEKIIKETISAAGSTAANPKAISAGDVEMLLEKLFGSN